MGEAYLMRGADWSPDVSIIAHNGVLISKIKFKPIKLHVYDSPSDINYFNKVISDHW